MDDKKENNDQPTKKHKYMFYTKSPKTKIGIHEQTIITQTKYQR